MLNICPFNLFIRLYVFRNLPHSVCFSFECRYAVLFALFLFDSITLNMANTAVLICYIHIIEDLEDNLTSLSSKSFEKKKKALHGRMVASGWKGKRNI